MKTATWQYFTLEEYQGQAGRSKSADGGEGCGLHDGAHAGEPVLPNRVPDPRLLLVPDVDSKPWTGSRCS